MKPDGYFRNTCCQRKSVKERNAYPAMTWRQAVSEFTVKNLAIAMEERTVSLFTALSRTLYCLSHTGQRSECFLQIDSVFTGIRVCKLSKITSEKL